MKTISIMGSPVSSGNRGVLALGSSLASLCLKHPETEKVQILVGNANNAPFFIRHNEKIIAVEVVNYRLSPRSRLREHLIWIVFASILHRIAPFRRFQQCIESSTPWIKAVSNSDLVGDVRGGDSFSDIYGLQRFLISFLPIWSVILIKGSIVQFPQTYGPYKHWLAKNIAAYILRRSSTIIARDEKSRAVAESLVEPFQKVETSPDVAFSLTPIRPQFIETVPVESGMPDSSSIGLNVNGLMYNGGYTRNNMFGLKLDYKNFLTDLVERLLLEQENDIWLIPHTYAPHGDVESDNETALILRETISENKRHRVKVLTTELDQYEVKGLIGIFDFFIGSRMHSCIAALSQGVPCCGVAYSMKFKGVYDSIDMGEWVVDGREHDNASSIERIIELYKLRDSIRTKLSTNVTEAKRKLDLVFNAIIENAYTKNGHKLHISS